MYSGWQSRAAGVVHLYEVEHPHRHVYSVHPSRPMQVEVYGLLRQKSTRLRKVHGQWLNGGWLDGWTVGSKPESPYFPWCLRCRRVGVSRSN
jgi:hypothetical protein